MSDRPVTESPHGASQKHSPADQESSTSRPAPTPSWSDASRWLIYAALAIAVVAVVVAGLAYFYPAHKGVSIAQQGGDAKANVCSAYASAHKAVVINTHMQSANPNDPIAELSVATNARLALIGGGAYLQDRVEANAAAPADLASAANSFANTIEQLGINYLTQAGAAAQDPLRHDLDSQIAQLDKLCA
ncbi:hypothetical protein [Candidatus Mycobacterium methanotrophicum]|uniref:Alanine and proline rich membrane protein n=1 Tax=Candidatus Mycobacterium methanotrophicum TaxID=2943498 RepID=A0ABY4QJU7_9MYCO|nr:hypothetical protein [Candidatus Mycobacterium methanotrophicum]UQX10068.1 hypothetical protein M5I08_17890 [Candidatus Mycobacterium methanotrophicum]